MCALRGAEANTVATIAHGTLAGYRLGCRCVRCRVVNAERVQRQREGGACGPTMVPTGRAQTHLQTLKAAHVGAWRAAELAGLSKALVSKIRAGCLVSIKAETEAAILAVPVKPALGTLVSAAETWRRIRTLLAETYTKRELARKLGYKSKLPYLKGEGAKVTLRTALKVRRLYRQLEGGQDQHTPVTDHSPRTPEETDHD